MQKSFVPHKNYEQITSFLASNFPVGSERQGLRDAYVDLGYNQK